MVSTDIISGNNVNLVGHPYAPIGMGEHVRCTYRALRSAAIIPQLTDIYKLNAPDTDEMHEFAAACTNQPASFNIFHINGDEVAQALAHLKFDDLWSGYNIIYPAWELARYPEEWAVGLDLFDEIWAPSIFVKESIQGACKKPVVHMPLACDVVMTSLLSRRYFGISETDYIFLFFFDVRSFVTRKNPFAVIQAFRKLLRKRPNAHVKLLLKINGAEMAPDMMKQLEDQLADITDQVTIISRVMTDNEVKNLVRCCDCFVSLHRSEGYGRGMAEAMVLGKPVIATGYSGNMDFMGPQVSFPVSHVLIPLAEGDYPHWYDQVWADPDIDEATARMVQLIDDPESGRIIGRKASLHMQKYFSYLAVGLNYRHRLDKLA